MTDRASLVSEQVLAALARDRADARAVAANEPKVPVDRVDDVDASLAAVR